MNIFTVWIYVISLIVNINILYLSFLSWLVWLELYQFGLLKELAFLYYSREFF